MVEGCYEFNNPYFAEYHLPLVNDDYVWIGLNVIFYKMYRLVR